MHPYKLVWEIGYCGNHLLLITHLCLYLIIDRCHLSFVKIFIFFLLPNKDEHKQSNLWWNSKSSLTKYKTLASGYLFVFFPHTLHVNSKEKGRENFFPEWMIDWVNDKSMIASKTLLSPCAWCTFNTQDHLLLNLAYVRQMKTWILLFQWYNKHTCYSLMRYFIF